MAFTQLEMLLSQNIDHFPKQSTTRQLQVRSERSSQIKFKLFSTHNFNYLHLYISMQVFGFLVFVLFGGSGGGVQLHDINEMTNDSTNRSVEAYLVWLIERNHPSLT